MQIALYNLGKHYNYRWVFKNLSFNFESGYAYAVTGPNGSGKSTLLQIIAGFLIPSEGNVVFFKERQIPPENHFGYLSVAAPYIELIHEYTFSEMIDFHFSLKSYVQGLDKEKLLEATGLVNERDKYLKNFSSGMMQRVKLALALFSNVSLLLLDEPSANLDTKGFDWYKEMILEYKKNRIVLIFSNQYNEYDFCDQVITLQQHL